MLEIKNLCVAIGDRPILKGVNLRILPGEIHAIMGPNGTGKSTLGKVISGDPSYEVTDGEILFQGNDILDMEPEQRALLGIFLGFQYPVEIPGITNFQFLHAAVNAQRKKEQQTLLTEALFDELLSEKMALVSVKEEFKYRSVNGGFSGGEKKKNEILQMAVLNPRLSILDETDSGLDIDAMRVVAEGVLKLLRPDTSLLLITHYQRLLDYIKPHFIHVMIDGHIVTTADASLALELEKEGYDRWSVSC